MLNTFEVNWVTFSQQTYFDHHKNYEIPTQKLYFVGAIFCFFGKFILV